MEMRKVFDYVKEHKKEIAVAAVGIVCVVGIGVIVRGKPVFRCADKTLTNFGKCKNIDIPEVGVGLVTDLWDEGCHTHAIIDNIAMADLGRVGEIFKNVEGVTDDTQVSAFFGFVRNAVES